MYSTPNACPVPVLAQHLATLAAYRSGLNRRLHFQVALPVMVVEPADHVVRCPYCGLWVFSEEIEFTFGGECFHAVQPSPK